MHIRQVTIRPYYARVYLKSLVYTIAITANRPCVSSVVLLSSHTNGTLALPPSAVRRIASPEHRLRRINVACASLPSLQRSPHGASPLSAVRPTHGAPHQQRFRRYRRFRRSSYGASHQRPSVVTVASVVSVASGVPRTARRINVLPSLPSSRTEAFPGCSTRVAV